MHICDPTVTGTVHPLGTGRYKNDDICTVCGASQWKENEISCNVRPSMSSKKNIKKAKKILRWFPVKPILLRLFMCSKTTNSMR